MPPGRRTPRHRREDGGGVVDDLEHAVQDDEIEGGRLNDVEQARRITLDAADPIGHARIGRTPNKRGE